MFCETISTLIVERLHAQQKLDVEFYSKALSFRVNNIYLCSFTSNVIRKTPDCDVLKVFFFGNPSVFSGRFATTVLHERNAFPSLRFLTVTHSYTLPVRRRSSLTLSMHLPSSATSPFPARSRGTRYCRMFAIHRYCRRVQRQTEN